MKKITLKLNGMHCTTCSVLIDTVLEELNGIKSSRTSYAEQTVIVEYDPDEVAVEQMIETIKTEGYEAQLAGDLNN